MDTTPSDNIIIEKIWQDNGFFEAKVQCSSEMITASANVYISDDQIDALEKQLSTFLNNRKIEKVYWESGELGDQSPACVTFLFFRPDSLGHICIEVFLELDDGGKFSKHNCCFYVHAETQQICDFLRQLPILRENENIGCKVSLKSCL